MDMTDVLNEALGKHGLDGKRLELLASQLIWRMGRLGDDGPVVIRVGYCLSAPLFADLPRLRNTSDQELEAAVNEGNIQVEWVGQAKP